MALSNAFGMTRNVSNEMGQSEKSFGAFLGITKCIWVQQNKFGGCLHLRIYL